MCGIAGAVDLRGRRTFPAERLLAMTRAIAHRGPDDEQIHIEPGVALGVRRLAIIDVAGGRQPLCNETGDVWVAYEGELYDYQALFQRLTERGHTLKTRCDTEAWVHLYEDHGETSFEHVQGQFAVALWDRNRRLLLLARDRPGIAPLFYTEVDGWLLWASEIKALLASGMVTARPDPKALNYFFHFWAMPNKRTCFADVHSIAPGQYLRILDGRVECRTYWDIDYPDAGQERRFDRVEQAVDELDEKLTRAVRRRFISERPVCCYISGGLDSTTLLGLSSKVRGAPVPSFTVSLDNAGPYDERTQAEEAAGLLNSPLSTLRMTSRDIADAYPEVIRIAEAPVLDTASACTLRLAQHVRKNGFVVSLSGEGADEAFAGYIWFKLDPLIGMLGRHGYGAVRRILLGWMAGGGTRHMAPWAATAGVRTSQQFPYEMMAQSREHLYSPDMWSMLGDHSGYDELELPEARFRRWHPLNQSLYLANKIMLPGMLLAAKGDRAMHNASTEGRFPFLDEEVTGFCAGLEPRMKLRGLTDKWLLRRLAKKVLPPAIANRPKTMFRAHLGTTFLGPDRPAWVDQLLSPVSLRATGYFSEQGVQQARAMQARKPRMSFQRFVLDMGIGGVLATQLWHHVYCGGGLADLPTWTAPERVEAPAVEMAMNGSLVTR
ncbi:asparagine synthetase B [Planctomycetaceae bacterium SCGC AG-212-D15]|nr:asparagine synthetase B [Planctomycetaceae bacterium SCGC AG-212-D15]